MIFSLTILQRILSFLNIWQISLVKLLRKTDQTWEETAPRSFGRQYIVPVGLTEISPKKSEPSQLGFGVLWEKKWEVQKQIQHVMIAGLDDIMGCQGSLKGSNQIARPSVKQHWLHKRKNVVQTYFLDFGGTLGSFMVGFYLQFSFLLQNCFANILIWMLCFINVLIFY